MKNINYFFQKKRANFGDIISVNMGLYRHYGVYISDNTVIHYASFGGDFGRNVCIHATSLRKFLNGSMGYEVCVFPNGFNGKETVKRALSRIGERRYSLFANNCEHFATWCKTGVSYSKQI